jgi:cyclase
MLDSLNRRRFLQLSVATGAVIGAPRWIMAQAKSQLNTSGADTPVKTTKLYDNVFLLQGEGGNMAVQTGPEGKVLIDASYPATVPRIRAALDALSKDPAYVLINTHWHNDHTGGNAGMHAAGFTICAHQQTRLRLSTPQTMKMFHSTVPATPAAALPTITFDHSMHVWHNGDSLDLVHFAPAHTDTDVYIHFHKANVLHLGDIWFNGMYPFIDEGTGGTIGGMIRAVEKALPLADSNTKIIPGHGSLGSKSDLQKYHDMLSTIRDKVASIKASGASEQETVARKPTANFDAGMNMEFMDRDKFTGLVYRTL